MDINFVKKISNRIFSFIFYIVCFCFFIFVTLHSYLFFQSIKNNGPYFQYMEKCVDNGTRYWTCHVGKEEQKELIYVE